MGGRIATARPGGTHGRRGRFSAGLPIMTLLARINEGQTIRIPVDGYVYGGDPDLLFDIGATLSFGGVAVLGEDYTFDYEFTASGIVVTVTGLRDDLPEGIETGIVTVDVTVTTIVPGKTGFHYQNELGDWIEGSLRSESFALEREIEINSAPVGVLEAITHVGGGSPDVVADLAPFVRDGPGETVSFEPAGFSVRGVRGEIDAEGRIRILEVGRNAPESVTVDVVAVDDGGARATLRQVINLVRLSVVDAPSTLILYEGESAGPLTFRLSRAIDEDVEFSVVLDQPDDDGEVALMTGTLRAGETEVSFVPVALLEDAVLEKVGTAHLTVKAAIGAQEVRIAGMDGAGIAVQFWDKALRPSEEPYWEDGFAAGRDLFGTLFEGLETILALQPDAQYVAQATKYVGRLNLLLGLAEGTIEATASIEAYVGRMVEANALTDRDAKIAASYHANQELFAEIGLQAGKALFTVALAEGAAGFAAGLIAGLAGAASAPVWVPVLAGAAVGIGAAVLYDAYADEIKKTLGAVFSDTLPQEKYTEWYDHLSNPLLDDLTLRLGTGTEGLLAMTGAGELVLLGQGAPGLAGTAAALDGDVVLGLGGGGKVLVRGAAFGKGDLAVLQGSAILRIDSDRDGVADTELTLKGDYAGYDFVVRQTPAGTLITAKAPPAPVVLRGGVQADLLEGAGGRDSLDGQGGNDRLRGLAGDDLLRGGAGHDTLEGGAGADTMIGGAGRDLYLADGADTIIEARNGGIDTLRSAVGLVLGGNLEHLELTGAAGTGTGNALANRITGTGRANTLSGAAGADTLDGGAGADRLLGGAGDDSLSGGAGADRLTGSAGRDLLRGGAGADRFVFAGPVDSRRGAADTILDFGIGRDMIDLSGMDADTARTGDQAFRLAGSAAAHAVWLVAEAGGLLLRGDVNGDHGADFEIRFSGIDSLKAGDFLL